MGWSIYVIFLFKIGGTHFDGSTARYTAWAINIVHTGTVTQIPPTVIDRIDPISFLDPPMMKVLNDFRQPALNCFNNFKALLLSNE